MHRIARAVGSFCLAGIIALVALVQLGVADLRWPWTPGDVLSHDLAIGAPAEVAIIRIEPISLDCRARIHAVVPVEGRKEHRAFGQVYRTDRVRIDAVGDIDTCVESSSVEVVQQADGTTRVLVPADAIEFVRPRVDAEATLGSVSYDKGMFGKLTDALPWVEDSEGLTSAGYAFAQRLVASEACLSAAFDQTAAALREAYRGQAVISGQPANSVSVEIIGRPDFTQDPPTGLESFDFVVNENATCSVVTGNDVIPA